MHRVRCSLIWLTACLAASSVVAEIGNAVVAIVGESVITWADVEQYISKRVEFIQKNFRNQPAVLDREMREAKRLGVEDLVARKLILNEFKTSGRTLPESILEDVVRQNIRRNFGDQLTLTKSLAAEGLTKERWREQVREDFIVSAMRAHNIKKDIIISPHKIEKYYVDHLDQFKVGDEVKLRTIMVNRTGHGSADAARKLAEEILSKLKDGASFAQMASVYSEDSFASHGGDRGWVDVKREHFHKELEQAMLTLQPGQRSGLIDAGEVFWIVLVEDAKSTHVKTLPEVRDEIEQTLKDQEQDRLNKEWIDRLKAKAFVRYF